MKALLVVVAGALPLLILTVINLMPIHSDQTGENRPDGESAPLSRPKIEEIAKLAESRAAAARGEREMVDQLVVANFFSTKVPPELRPAADLPPRFQALLQSWPEIQKAQADALTFLEIYRGKPAPDVELTRLTALRSKQTFHGVPGGNEIAEQLVDGRIQSLEQHNSSEQLLQRARTAFTSRHFDDCLKALAQIPSDSVTPVEKGQIDELKRSASFWRHWAGRPLNRDVSQNRLDKLKELRERTPAAVSPDEQAHLKKIDEEIDELGRQVRLAEFLKSPPTRLREFAAESREIFASDSRAAGRLRAKLEEWVETHFPERPLSGTSVLNQEAWKKDGTLLKGVFKEGSEANAKSVWYQYWSTEGAYRKKQAYEQTVYLSNLKGPPQTPPDVRTVEEFNLARRALFKKMDSQSSWEEFVTTCERLDRELDEYRKAGGTTPAPLSFEKEQKTAEEVLSSWPDLKLLWER